MIVMSWTFLDYVDASGSSQIATWLADLPPSTRLKVRSKLLWVIVNHTALGQPLSPPFFEALSGNHSGLIAIRFQVLGVAYRPLCCYGPRTGDVTLLAGATEHNYHYRPPGVRDTALARRAEVRADGKRAMPTCLFEEIN